jgi:hypothetical protein
MLKRGNIYVIYCNYIKPPHDKICLCFCEIDRLFFFINSAPRLTPDAQEIIHQAEQANVLTHDSYIDLSGPKTFSADEVLKAQDRGPLAPAAIQRIRARLLQGPSTLSARYKALALANLT